MDEEKLNQLGHLLIRRYFPEWFEEIDKKEMFSNFRLLIPQENGSIIIFNSQEEAQKAGQNELPD